jgi:Icc-related predicted phosphoesterase
MAEYFSRMLWQAEQSRKILLLGSAPSGPLGGPSEEAEIAGQLINSCHPHLCAVGGKTERRGTQRIASTTIVNPGRLSDGSAAWFDWTRPRNEQVEILDLGGTPFTS